MADEEEDLDLDVKSGNKTNTILLIVLLVLLLVVGGGGAAFFLLGDDKGGSKSAEKTATEEAAEVQMLPAIYYPLKPEFVVNLDSAQVKFLQVELQLMTRNQELIPVLEHHMPVIRNNIMLLLSSQKYEVINTREGKEQLRNELRDSIQSVVSTEAPDMEIEAVYITSLVMQ